MFLRFLGGRFDILWGGTVEDVAHILSGGIYDCYHTANTQQNTPKHPDASELFTILQQALMHSNLMSCSIHTKKAYIGITQGHEFTITDVLTIQNTRLLKLHNPHNSADQDIKK